MSETPRRRGRPRIVRPEGAPKEQKKRGRKPGSLNKTTTVALARRSSPRVEAANSALLLALPFASGANGPDPVLARVPVLSADGFVEPELAPLRPGISGFPLEALPPKAKRPVLGGRGRKPKNRGTTPEENERDAAAQKVEAAYRQSLQTPRLELLTAASEIRTGPRKRGRPRKDGLAADHTDTDTAHIKAADGEYSARTPSTPRGAKRLKTRLKGLPQKGRLFIAPQPEDTTQNDDYCATCGGTGEFICCDLCPKSFHLLCCGPPLREVPEDNWNCSECRAAQGMTQRRLWNSVGVFGALLNALHGRNPREYCLPRRLRENTFIDVSAGPSGQYTDALLKPERTSRADELDIDALYDRAGRPFLCHRCRMSGRANKTLVACDYCPLKWHLDCLPEPVCLAKTLGMKWRCPNHVALLYPLNWHETRFFRDTPVLDLALHAHFLKIAMASNFLIKHEDQPYIADARTPLLAEYVQYQKQDFVSNTTRFVDAAQKDGDNLICDNDDDTAPQFRVPDFMQNYYVDGRIVARSSRRLGKILLMTNADDPDKTPFIYRVPERQVLLDFLRTRSKQLIMESIGQYEQRAQAEAQRDALVAEDLAALAEKPTEKVVEHADTEHAVNNSTIAVRVEKVRLDELVVAAAALESEENTSKGLLKESEGKRTETENDSQTLKDNVTLDSNGSDASNGQGECRKPENGRSPEAVAAGSTGSNKGLGGIAANVDYQEGHFDNGNKPTLPEISADEISQLRQVKKLMDAKGHKALLEFLRS